MATLTHFLKTAPNPTVSVQKASSFQSAPSTSTGTSASASGLGLLIDRAVEQG